MGITRVHRTEARRGGQKMYQIEVTTDSPPDALHFEIIVDDTLDARANERAAYEKLAKILDEAREVVREKLVRP